MNAPEHPLTWHILQQEERAWGTLNAVDYDRAVCRMVEQIGADLDTPERVEALLGLSAVSLRRNAPRVIDSRASLAERLLMLTSRQANAAPQARVVVLFLLAWLRLGTEAAAGPESVSTMPDLPHGAALPSGADPRAITDPVLRQKARELEARHEQEVERWTAKQHAIHQLYHLAALFGAVLRNSGPQGEALKTLASAMSAAPGLTPELRTQLEEKAR